MTQAEADVMPRGIFQFYVMGDPTLRESPYVFTTGRLIDAYDNRKPLPAVPTIGSLGFAVPSKGFWKLISAVQEEFDEAVVRINIPPNGIIDREAQAARAYADECRRWLWKPGVKLEITHEFFDREGMLDFLASNTLNAFLYDYLPKAGISSTPDHALAVRRPVAISRSIMFRHLHRLDPPITFEDTTFAALIRNGTRPFDHLLREWSAEGMRLRYEAILSQTLARAAELPPVSSRGRAPAADPSHNPEKLGGLLSSPMMDLPLRALRAARRRAGEYAQRVPGLKRYAQFKVEELKGNIKPKSRLNRILDDQARFEYRDVIKEVERLVPDLVAKKLARANIQQAFVFDTVRRFARDMQSPRMLCVGSFEDSASAALKKLGFAVDELDPVVNQLSLDAFCALPTTKEGSYDAVFSTSVLEHVKDDEKFTGQMAWLLKPKGVGVLTCDFKDGWQVGQPLIHGDFRFYTKEDLGGRIRTTLKECDLVDDPQWSAPEPDFEFLGYTYTFATLVFRKR